MASAGDKSVTTGHEAQQEVQELKRDLEGWREVMLPLRGLLTWEQPYHPAIIFAAATVVFSLLWLLDPSVVTTVGVLGLMITTFDFAVPFVAPYFFSSTPWTGREERQFEEICERILHFRAHIHQFVEGLAILKSERPKIYFLVVMGVLMCLAWIGYIMNTLFLTYLLVLTVLMVPGLRQKGFLQRYFLKYWLLIIRVLYGRFQVTKSKEN